MKRFISLLLIMLISISNISCSKKETAIKEMTPQISQMRNICELATMECYYHNVAKYNDTDVAGALWWKKDRRFWIEYAGIVKIGIDASLVNIELNDDTVVISIPPAKVLSCKVDETTLNEDSFYIDKDSAKVEAQHQTQAFSDAERIMLETAQNDTNLLSSAQERAKNLLKDYVNNMGELLGKSYTIKWVYLENVKNGD